MVISVPFNRTRSRVTTSFLPYLHMNAWPTGSLNTLLESATFSRSARSSFSKMSARQFALTLVMTVETDETFSEVSVFVRFSVGWTFVSCDRFRLESGFERSIFPTCLHNREKKMMYVISCSHILLTRRVNNQNIPFQPSTIKLSIENISKPVVLMF